MNNEIKNNNLAVAYIRVSTNEQETSLASQTERLEAYCRMQGLVLTGVISEEGVSGSIAIAERPQGKEMLRAVKEGLATHIVALKLDRLFRDVEDAMKTTKAWTKAGVTLHLVDMGGQTLNTSGSMGRMMLTLMAAFAEFERNLIAERTSAALQHKKSHRKVYNHTPFGFTRDGSDLVACKKEMALVDQARAMRARGCSLRTIAGKLNSGASSPLGKNGGRFHASTIKNLVENNLLQYRVKSLTRRHLPCRAKWSSGHPYMR